MAEQKKIQHVMQSQFDGGGWRVKMADGTWVGSKDRREDVLVPGYTIKYNTMVEGKNTFINQAKVVEKGQPEPFKKAGGGGGGFKADPVAKAAQEARYAAQAVREEAKHRHQLEVIEPRIVYSDARSKAIGTVDLYIRNGALALGAESAGKRKGVIDAAIAAATEAYFEATVARFNGGAVATKAADTADMSDLEDDDLDGGVADDLDVDDEIL